MNNTTRRQAIGTLGVFTLSMLPLKLLASSRVAIVCEAQDDNSRQDVARFQSVLGGSLLKTGRFSLVDRDRIDRIIREQGFSNSDYADPHTAAKLGKLAGAQSFLNVQVSSEINGERGGFVSNAVYHVSANFTLVNTSTGAISSEGTADGEAQSRVATGGGFSTMELASMRREAISSCIDDLIQQVTS